MAAAKGYSPARLTAAWLLPRNGDILPLVGMSRPAHVIGNQQTLGIAFAVGEPAKQDRASGPNAIRGDRYPEMG